MICKICGKEFTKLAYSGEYKDICCSECFHIEFWNQIISDKGNPNRAFINHIAYYIGPEESNSPFRGFSGHKFTIRFFDDDSVVTTTNLWDNGDIPEKYWDYLPDNAEFI